MPAPGVPLTERQAGILMELQYRFPRSPTPYCDAAERLGLEPGELLGELRRLHREGVLKRVGFYVNYRSRGLRAALIAYEAPGREEELARIYAGDEQATHVYVRDHPVYNVWVVTKRPTLEELVEHARRVAGEVGGRFVVLYSRRTYKLSVKFDLWEGVSRSGPYSLVHESPPSPGELGVDPGALRLLRSLPLEERPYRPLASRLGVGEGEAAALAWKLLDAGVLGDPGAALDGHRAGFRENAMVVMEPGPGGEGALCECAARSPHTTHVVLRGSIPEGAWRHTCYFMVHAVDGARLSRLVEEVTGGCGPRDYMVIRSLADLKPGAVR